MAFTHIVLRAALGAAAGVAVAAVVRRFGQRRPAPAPPPHEVAVPLHTAVSTATGSGASAGQHVSARLAGKVYRESTGFWVGCAGEPAVLSYPLGGRYGRLTATVGLAETAPDDLAVQVDIRLDGRAVTTLDVHRRRPAPLDVDLIGVEALTFAALRTAGECGESLTPYGVLGNAVLRR